MERNALTLEEAIEAHRLDMQWRRLSPRTLEEYAYMLNPFIDFLQDAGVNTVGEIRASHIRAWLLALQSRGLSPSTQNTAAKCIKAWLNFLVREGELDASPMRTVPMPRLKRKRPTVFTLEEVETLLDVATTERDRAMILFMLDTGARKSEIVALNVEDVNLETGVVHINAGKGGKDRSVFLGARSRRALRHYLAERERPAPDSPLWASLITGDRLTPAGIRMLFRRLRERSDIPHCSPHTFRRTCALWCLRQGMDVYTVAAIMGHSDISTLRHYLHFIEDDLREAHRRYGPVNGYLSSQEGKT